MPLKPGDRLPRAKVDIMDLSEVMDEDMRGKLDTLRTLTPPKPNLFQLEGGPADG